MMKRLFSQSSSRAMRWRTGLRTWSSGGNWRSFSSSNHIDAHNGVMAHTKSRYKGVHIDLDSSEIQAYSADHKTFYKHLTRTLDYFRKIGRRGTWLHIPAEHGDLLPIATSLGFSCHHTDGNDVVMTNWLGSGDDSECKIPPFATHRVGVGGLVLDTQSSEAQQSGEPRVLAVSERYTYSPWKLPGGLSDLGEHISEAVVREVFEETGVNTRFQGVLSYRHLHGSLYGRSDIYFICLLTPEYTEAPDGTLVPPTIEKCDTEILDCVWMPLQEFEESADQSRHVMHLNSTRLARSLVEEHGDAVNEGYQGMQESDDRDAMQYGTFPSELKVCFDWDKPGLSVRDLTDLDGPSLLAEHDGMIGKKKFKHYSPLPSRLHFPRRRR